MRLALYFRFFGGFTSLSFVSGLRNITLDDNDPTIVYSVGWNESTANNPFDFGGSLHFSNNSTASASVTFRGVAVYLTSPFWSSGVAAQVVLDGQGPFAIDLEDYRVPAERGLGRETIQSQIVWSATDLPDTDHTMVISVPPGVEYVVLDGLIYSTSEANNAKSVPLSDTSTVVDFHTTTTTPQSTSSSTPFPSPSSSPSFSIIRSATSSSSTVASFSNSPYSSPAHPAPQFTANNPVNVASAPPTSASIVDATATPAVNAASTNVTRNIVVGSLFAAAMLILVVIVLLTCVRRRHVRQRKQQESYTWSQKFSPPTVHASRIASKTPPPRSGSPFTYEHSPVSAVPLLSPVVPAARRVPRSPLATAPPILPPTPSPQAAEFPMPPAIYTTHPFSPAPTTPLPLTPLPLTPLPPATPGTPWSMHKSHRFSASSMDSYESSSVESGVGYGWTTPSLVGIHPFSAPSEPEPSAGGSSAGVNSTVAPPKTLAPKLNEKSAEALFRTPEEQRRSAAPAYREKDAAQLFGRGRARAGTQTSETAPPVYEP